MPAKCVPCMGTRIKAVILEEVGTREMAAQLATIPDCDSELGLQLCTTGKGGKGKRAPSEYNLYVRECMKSRPKDKPASEHMKTCAIQYRERKGKGNGRNNVQES